MKTTLRNGLLGLVGAVAGFGLSGCFTPQPQPECSVTITSAGLGLVPYYTMLKKIDVTPAAGACGDLDHMYVGLQRFRTKASGGDFTVALKASPVADPYLGYVYSADTDEYNNCVNEESCHGEDDVTLSCVTDVLADGGVELFDGTPVDTSAMDGTGLVVDPVNGDYQVDLANLCGPVEEPLYRVDPMDMDGKNLNIIANMPQFPTAGKCALTQVSGGAQNYQAETALDGTVFPAITYKVEFTDTSVINNAEIPGIAFTGKVKYTEGGCVANYEAIGFWSGYNTGTPEIFCTPAAGSAAGSLSDAPECDPNADLDAGRLLGSGMSPAFKPKCRADAMDPTSGICIPSIDLTAVK